MKTDSLIDLLARGAGPAVPVRPARPLAAATAIGGLVSAALAVIVLGLVPVSLWSTPVPWMKLIYAGLLAAAALWLLSRLSRPALPPGAARHAVVGVVGVMALLGIASMMVTPPGLRVAAFLGHSWWSCPWAVMLLSVPGLAAVLWVVRGLAPTRLRATGFAAGLLAGAAGAMGYSLSCPEASPAFVAAWYTAGIALTALLGTLLGPRLLRW